MGSLSIGYWLGGAVSAKKSDMVVLGWMLLIAGVFMLTTCITHDYVLRRILKYVPEFRFRTVIAVALLFGPASVFLAMVLPYSVRMLVNNVRTSGQAVGNLYSMSTAGSIAGTFLAGFFLLPELGFASVLFANSGFLLIFALLLFMIGKRHLYFFIGLTVSIILIFIWYKTTSKPLDYIDTDTKYNRVLIYNSTDKVTGRPIKILNVNDERSSAMFTDADNDLVFEVLKYYRLAEHFSPGFKNSLMIGGSGYAFPKDYLRRYPEAAIDVVEIDPGLTELARRHFNLPDDPRLGIFHEDGRTFLNRCTNKYDAVFMDAYKSMLTIPYQLTTREAIEKIYNCLNENGAVYANIISTLNNEENLFLRSEIATYKSIFPQVYLFAVQYPNSLTDEMDIFRNFILVGLKSEIKPDLSNQDQDLNDQLSHLITIEPGKNAIVLTDEFAPVEYYASRALSRITRQK